MTEKSSVLVVGLGCLALAAGGLVVYRALSPNRAECRPGATFMARVELLFGAGGKDGGAVGEVEWHSFLAEEVTPRFADGLTVLTGYGQWRSGGTIAKESSRLLLIWYHRAADSDAKIEAIRKTYNTRFGQESVMRVDGAGCVSF
jgi:hypothetical protein